MVSANLHPVLVVSSQWQIYSLHFVSFTELMHEGMDSRAEQCTHHSAKKFTCAG